MEKLWNLGYIQLASRTWTLC